MLSTAAKSDLDPRSHTVFLFAQYASFATAFITNASNDKVPFFLYVPFSHVHTPQYGAPRNIGRSGRQGDAGHFYDSLLELDDTVGSIMAALKTSAVDDNTLVFVTGDNGCGFLPSFSPLSCLPWLCCVRRDPQW